MLISSVTHASAPASTLPDIQLAWLAPAQVSEMALQRAEDDGDGKTGAAALNDGDMAAQAAALQAHVEWGSIDVKA